MLAIYHNFKFILWIFLTQAHSRISMTSLHARILGVIFSEFVFSSDDFVTSLSSRRSLQLQTNMTGLYGIATKSSITQINIHNCTMTSTSINIGETVLTSQPRGTRERTNDWQTYFLLDRPKKLDQHPNQETYVIRTSPPGTVDVYTYAVTGCEPVTCSSQVFTTTLSAIRGGIMLAIYHLIRHRQN